MLSKWLLLVENILAFVVNLPHALVVYVRDWLHFRKLANRFPGPPPRPLIGNLFDSGLFPDTMTILKWGLDDVMHRYPAGQVFFGPIRFFFLSDVNHIQTFLMQLKNHSKPKLMTDFFNYLLGRGLISINGDEWRLHHKICRPGFHQNLLKTYVSTFNRKSDIFIERLAKHANGHAFDVKLMTETVEVDIILETLFGVPSNQQSNPDSEFFESIFSGQKELSQRIRSPWLYSDIVYNMSSSGQKAKEIRKYYCGFFNEIVEQRKEILRAKAESLLTKGNLKNDDKSAETPNVAPTSDADGDKNKKHIALIDALIQEDGRSINYTNVLDELLVIGVAGFDTSSIVLQFALYFLAKNPVVQEKALAELQTIFGVTASMEVTPETLQRMQYVEMIVNETLRMHPPIFFYLKEAGVDTPLVSCDLVVPAGATVVISPRSVHMDPKLYPNPHVFDPERFSPENCAKRHPFAFIPFAAGIRACIGKKFAMMSLKTVISKVIWNYRILPDETYEPQLHWGISMVTTNGMRIKLIKRSAYREE